MGPAAKASGGGSLFDTPAPQAEQEAKAAKPAEGGSLFDTPAPTEAKAETKAVEEPPKTPAAERRGLALRLPCPGSSEATPSEKAQAEAVAEEEPVTSEPENPPTAAEAKESTATPTPGTEIGSGSLFDLAAPEASPAEPCPRSPETKPTDEAGEEGRAARRRPEPPAPRPGRGEPTAPAPPVAKKIPEDGSLFDLSSPGGVT